MFATENDMGVRVPSGLYGSMVSPECPTASIGMETTSWPFCLCPGCHQDFGDEMPGKAIPGMSEVMSEVISDMSEFKPG